ncbi:MAG: alpha-amylase family glycosyl hydrolase [Bacteroidales bacterium]
MIYTEPAIPTTDAALTVYFDAVGTALEGYSGDLYAHTGVTVNGNQWNNVIGYWGNNSTQPQFVNVDVDLYKLELIPTIRDFYGVSGTGVISEVCMVIRNADGSAQTNPDIFIEVYEVGLNVNLISPSVSPYFVDPDEAFQVEAEATLSQTLSLFVDNSLIMETTGTSISETIVADSDPDTKHWIKVVASDGTNEVADSIYYYIRGASFVEDLPTGIRDGINYLDDNTVALVLNAPHKTSVYAIGDFNDWQVGPEYKLKCTTDDISLIDTRYWVTLENLNAGEEYAFQYLIDEELRIADPYTDKILDKWNDPYISNATFPNLKPYPENKTLGLVSVFQTAQQDYEWQVTSFDPPDQDKLIAYELLLRDFIQAHDFKTLKDTISYFKRLGINAIELMPVNEFEGNLSWGYNPSFYFAPDKYYGPKNDLKAFIDECHANGIAVIMDMVLNHAYGQNVMVQMYWDDENNRPAADNPWFNPVCPHEPYCWGNDFNHESPSTQAFVDSVNHYWMSEYNVDGFRFDFTQGFTNSNSGWQYNAGRIDLIKRMSDKIWSVNPNAYVILEHWCENSEEKELANYGCLLWGNSNYNYSEASMGWLSNSNFDWISYKQRGWSEPGVMGFMESHDEERVMAKNINYGNASGNYNIQDTTIALQRQHLTAVFFITIPGPKMIWQFGERGYDYYINWPGTIGEEDHRLDEKPPRWEYMNDSRRKVLYNIYSVLNHLKQEQEVFNTSDYNLSLNGAMKSIHLNHSSMNVTILGNFDVTAGNINPQFQHTGIW